MSKEQKRDYRRAVLTGRAAHDPVAATMVKEFASRYTRARVIASSSLAIAYTAVGIWVLIKSDRFTFFLPVGVFGLLSVAYLWFASARARRLSEPIALPPDAVPPSV
jgi:hypothetical protein